MVMNKIKHSIKMFLKFILPSTQRKALREMQAHMNQVFNRLSALCSGDLVRIGKAYGTDKGSSDHMYGGMSYLHIYQKYFPAFRAKPINLLEIGVFNGPL